MRRHEEVVHLHGERGDLVDEEVVGHREEVVHDLDALRLAARVEQVVVGGDLARGVDAEREPRGQDEILAAGDLGRGREEDVGDHGGQIDEGIVGAGVALGVRVGAELLVDGLGDDVGVVQARGGVHARGVHEGVVDRGVRPRDAGGDLLAGAERDGRRDEAEAALRRVGEGQLLEGVAEGDDVVVVDALLGLVARAGVDAAAARDALGAGWARLVVGGGARGRERERREGEAAEGGAHAGG